VVGPPEQKGTFGLRPVLDSWKREEKGSQGDKKREKRGLLSDEAVGQQAGEAGVGCGGCTF
jgi:hypothetical protein